MVNYAKIVLILGFGLLVKPLKPSFFSKIASKNGSSSSTLSSRIPLFRTGSLRSFATVGASLVPETTVSTCLKPSIFQGFVYLKKHKNHPSVQGFSNSPFKTFYSTSYSVKNPEKNNVSVKLDFGLKSSELVVRIQEITQDLELYSMPLIERIEANITMENDHSLSLTSQSTVSSENLVKKYDCSRAYIEKSKLDARLRACLGNESSWNNDQTLRQLSTESLDYIVQNSEEFNECKSVFYSEIPEKYQKDFKQVDAQEVAKILLGMQEVAANKWIPNKMKSVQIGLELLKLFYLLPVDMQEKDEYDQLRHRLERRLNLDKTNQFESQYYINKDGKVVRK